MNLEDELERCRPWIEAALEYTPDTHVFNDIVDGIRKGTLQLWGTPKGCIVTEIICYPRKKKLHVFLGRQSGADYGYARGRSKVGKAARLQQFNNDGTFRLEETVSN